MSHDDKKGRQKFWRMKIGTFSGRRSNWGNSLRSPKISWKKGEIWNRGKMHHCLRGMDALGWTGERNLSCV